MIGCKIRLKKRRAGGAAAAGESSTEWLVNLLGSKFFGSCVDHRELRKNEKNVFCIDCKLCFCKHCNCFRYHRRLQICRYVYRDVVRLADIQQHLDCSLIQTYKINGEKAVHLNSRPQSSDAKICKSKSSADCEACGRHIQDFPSRFCSIACKVSLVAEITRTRDSQSVIPYSISDYGHFSWKKNDYSKRNNRNESESTISSAESFEEIQAIWVNNSKVKPKKVLHKRKGIPRRSPLR